MEALSLSRDPVASMSGLQDSHDRLSLPEISLKSSGLNMGLPTDMTGIAPSFLSNVLEPSPPLSPASSHADPLEILTSSTPGSGGIAETEGPELSVSRKGGRNRSNASQTQVSTREADKRRSKVLGKNRMAAKRYRTRQKEYVENLERRCKKENEQRRMKSTLVKSLQEEILRLEAEVAMQGSLCSCMHVKG